MVAEAADSLPSGATEDYLGTRRLRQLHDDRIDRNLQWDNISRSRAHRRMSIGIVGGNKG